METMGYRYETKTSMEAVLLIVEEAKMKSYQREAIEILEDYPTSPYKASLLTMVNYVIDREK